jgi:hypothetical protein
MIKKIIKWVAYVVGTIVILLGLIIAGISIVDPIMYSSFYKEARKEFKIPGLNDNFTPQGLAYADDYGIFIGSGYDKKTSEAVMYVIDRENKTSKKVLVSKLNTTTGDYEAYKGHAGGISIDHDDVYLSNSSKIFVLSLQDILAATTERVQIKSYFSVATKASYCFTDDNYLYVGEFEDAKNNYKTDDTHHLVVGTNETNKGFTAVYKLSDVKEANEESKLVPEYIYSHVSKVQGIAISAEGRVILSTSYGLTTSRMHIYQSINVSSTDPDSTYTVNDVNVPVYYLNNARLERIVKSSAMSEDLDYVDGRVYIFNESASNKYIFGKFTRAKNVYSYPVA